jgi:predicted transcriptional regulator of viral defense system
MASRTALAQLGEIAADQWGLITRRQADDVGIPHATLDRLLADDHLVERVAHGVYRLRVAPPPDHLTLRAAWLGLAPGTPAWARRPEQGVISHRSAAAVYGIGDLPADAHDFTLPVRRQTRRADVRLHRRPVLDGEYAWLRGLPVTRPARIVDDLLRDDEGPDAVAQVAVDALRAGHDDPGALATTLVAHAARFRLPREDGIAVLEWLLGLVGDPASPSWLDEARASLRRDRSAAVAASSAR